MKESIEQIDKEDLMSHVEKATKKIHSLQDEIVETGKQRRSYVLELRKHNVTYKDIAKRMNVSEVTVYKIIVGK